MGQAIGDILSLAIGVAISPVPIIALILMLITPKAKTNGTAFAFGWVLGLCVVGFGGLLIANAADLSTGQSAETGVAWGKVVLGVLFLWLALKQWRARPKAGEEAAMPAWMGAIDAFTAGKALGLGAALSGVNPKNLILTLSAAATVAEVPDLSGAERAVSMLVFIVIASLTVLAPLVVYLAMGAKAEEILSGWKAWLSLHDSAIMFVLFLVFGMVLIGKGMGVLS
jgi:hypothetical protein